jgi:hypothetical protein
LGVSRLAHVKYYLGAQTKENVMDLVLVRVEQKRMYTMLVEKPERNNLEDLSVNGRKLLIRKMKKHDARTRAIFIWFRMARSGLLRTR